MRSRHTASFNSERDIARMGDPPSFEYLLQISRFAVLVVACPLSVHARTMAMSREVLNL